jgi:type II secretory pathway pseudopilin PulG
MHEHTKTRGFTYLGVLFLLAFLGIALGAATVLWRLESQRQREAELLFIGAEFQRALAAYYDGSPAPAKTYPRALDDLLRDPRYPDVRRYLRRVYVDPMTGGAEWGLLRLADGGITGVYSRSDKAPLKRANFAGDQAAFAGAKTYADWRFLPAGRSRSASASAQPGAMRHPLADAARAANASGAAADAEETSPQSSACNALLASDTSACADAQRRNGAEQGATCRASAQARHQACLNGETGGRLLTRPEFSR